MLAKQGSFAARTGSPGNQSVTGLGIGTPKAVIFFATRLAAAGFGAGQHVSFGWATSSSQRAAVAYASDDAAVAVSNSARLHYPNYCILLLSDGTNATGTPPADGSADFVSFDSDGFTINWADPPAQALLIQYLVLGGSDLTNAKAGVVVGHNSTNNQGVTGVGFQPDCALFIGARLTGSGSTSGAGSKFSLGAATSPTSRACSAIGEQDAVALGDVRQQQVTNRVAIGMGAAGTNLWESDLVSFDSDGLTLSWSAATTASVFYLALKGGKYKVGTETQKTSTGTKATAGLGQLPRGLLLFGCNAASSSAVDQTQQRLSIGAASGTSARGAIWSQVVDNVLPTNTNQLLRTDKVLEHASSDTTTNAAADLSSFAPDSFTLDWTTADSTAREFAYLALGNVAAAVGQAAETDLAQPITVRKTRSFGQPTETDAPQALTVRKTRAVGQASEAETPQALTARKSRSFAQASETDEAQVVSPGERFPLSQATEADLAQALTAAKRAGVGQTVEAETARSFTVRKTVTLGQASESDASQTFSAAKRAALSQASESDAAQALTSAKRLTFGQTLETDEAQLVTAGERFSASQAVETDEAQPFTSAKRTVLGQTGESDTAQSVAGTRAVALGQATDTEVAQPVTTRKSLTVGLAAEADDAQPITSGESFPVLQATETDSASVFTALKAGVLGQASETDEAQAVTPRGVIVASVGQASETDEAQPLTVVVPPPSLPIPQGGWRPLLFHKTISVRGAEEFDRALSIQAATSESEEQEEEALFALGAL